MSRKPKLPPARNADTHDALLGDLESLRTLLDQEKLDEQGLEESPGKGSTPRGGAADDTRTREPAGAAGTNPLVDDSDDVPVLEDMVEGALTISESVLTSRASFDDGMARPSNSGGHAGLGDDTIKALLGDEWRMEARKILADARSTLEGSGGNWSTGELNALNESLKVRIDRTLDDWLVEMMNARIDDLRARLLRILENELEHFTRAVTDREQHGE